MDFVLEWLQQFVAERNHPLGLALLFGAAMFEYIFPPFPGDAITLFSSSVLCTRYGWSPAWVFAAILVGSQCGAMIAFYVGKKLARPADMPRTNRRLDRLLKNFARYGPAYLCINRFVPVFRPLFFIAAGLAHMRPRQVFIYSTISAALWNGLLMTLGILVGVNFDTLMDWASRYTLVALGVIAAGVTIYVLYRRRRPRA